MSKYEQFFSTRSLLIWPTLPIKVYFKKKSSWKPFPLSHKNCRVYSLARQAIWNACQAAGFNKDDVILVPAYHHGSEIEALLQAGLQIRYYEVNDDLEPILSDLDGLLEPKVRALYIIHYLGFPQNAVFWKEWCAKHGIMLIEDAAQAFLATIDEKPVGSFGDIGFFCLYKTYGIPDGGAVISENPPAVVSSSAQAGVWRVFKRHVNWLAARYGIVGSVHLIGKPIQVRFRRLWNSLNERPHSEFEMGNPSTVASAMTVFLLPRVLDEDTAHRRREHYRYLLSHLGDMVPQAFTTLPAGASPFAFPVEVNNPRAFLSELRRRGVIGLLFWLNPHPSLPVEDFPNSKRLREGVLALPVHQELTVGNLQQIVEAVQSSRTSLRLNAFATG